MDELFRISGWKPFEKGALRGFFTVHLPNGIVIHNCGVFEKNGSRWVALPSKKITSTSGKVTWSPIVEIPDRDAMDRFRILVLAALNAEGIQ
jgi:DNA-binding cell septation regulator SpoVG